MAVRPLGPATIATPDEPIIRRNAELVKPTQVQIRIAKAHIVGLASHQQYLQSHRDQLEAELAQLDPAEVAAVKVQGYPPIKKHR